VPPAWILLTALAAAGQSGSRPTAESLAGRWTVTLWVDSSRVARPAPRGAAITGTITLKAVATADRITLTGRYALDLAAFGLGPNSESVLAFGAAGDTIQVILRPDVDHGHASLVGVFRLGRLEGRWTWIGDPTFAAGRFVMHR